MIELKHDRLTVSFPDLHPKARMTLAFQRTLRVPDDNQDYPLPAGLGTFPLLSVNHCEVPPHWRGRGGVLLPMYQSEAMWINLTAGNDGYPMAVKIAAGKINAVTGQPWSNELSAALQDYVVIPTQPWLDGFSVSRSIVRQFVAAPLYSGLTAEEQMTGEGRWGGIQMIFYPMKAEVYRRRFERPPPKASVDRHAANFDDLDDDIGVLGLAPGGRIRQEIAADPFGISDWEANVSSRCFIHLLNSKSYEAVTGQAPPESPVTPEEYARAGIPWFDYYHDGKILKGSQNLAALDGLGTALMKKGDKLDDNRPVYIQKTFKLSKNKSIIEDGDF